MSRNFCSFCSLSVTSIPICPLDFCSISLSFLPSFRLMKYLCYSIFPLWTYESCILSLVLGGYPGDFNTCPWLTRKRSKRAEAGPASCSAGSLGHLTPLTPPAFGFIALLHLNSTYVSQARTRHCCLSPDTRRGSIYPGLTLSVPSDVPTFLQGYFLSTQRTHFRISFVLPVVMNSLSVSCLKRLHLEAYFYWRRIAGWQFFFYSALSDCHSAVFSFPGFWWELSSRCYFHFFKDNVSTQLWWSSSEDSAARARLPVVEPHHPSVSCHTVVAAHVKNWKATN